MPVAVGSRKNARPAKSLRWPDVKKITSIVLLSIIIIKMKKL